MSYTHLTTTERVKIETYLELGMSIRSIARRLGRQPSTVSREIRRNLTTRCAGRSSRSCVRPGPRNRSSAVSTQETLPSPPSTVGSMRDGSTCPWPCSVRRGNVKSRPRRAGASTSDSPSHNGRPRSGGAGRSGIGSSTPSSPDEGSRRRASRRSSSGRAGSISPCRSRTAPRPRWRGRSMRCTAPSRRARSGRRRRTGARSSAATRTPTASCASSSRKDRTSRRSAKERSWTRSPRSTGGRGNVSAGRPHTRPSRRKCCA